MGTRQHKLTAKGFSNTTSTYNGFKQEEDKQQFISELENLRKLMRNIRDEVSAADGVDEDDKDEIFADLIKQINDLKAAKQQAEEIATTLAAENRPIILCATLSSSDCLKNKGINAIDAFFEFWENWSVLCEQQNHLIMICLCFNYNTLETSDF